MAAGDQAAAITSAAASATRPPRETVRKMPDSISSAASPPTTSRSAGLASRLKTIATASADPGHQQRGELVRVADRAGEPVRGREPRPDWSRARSAFGCAITP